MFERYFGLPELRSPETSNPLTCLTGQEPRKCAQGSTMLPKGNYSASSPAMSGAGKTTIVRWFVEELPPRAKYKTLYIHDSELTPRNLYWECLNQLGIKPRFIVGTPNAS